MGLTLPGHTPDGEGDWEALGLWLAEGLWVADSAKGPVGWALLGDWAIQRKGLHVAKGKDPTYHNKQAGLLCNIGCLKK